MDIRSLKYFLAIADSLSITKASVLANTTQPNLTRQLKALEDELGKPLFIRGRHLVLTEAGKLLRRRAIELVTLYDKSYKEVKEFGKEEHLSGTVYIGGGESKAFASICQAYHRLSEDNPDIKMEIYSGDHIDLVEKMDKGLLDFAVLVEPANLENFESIRLPIIDTWGILARKDSPIAQKMEVFPEDLVDAKMILSRHILKSSMFFTWLGRPENQIDIVARYNLIYNAALLVREGVGYALTLDGLADTGVDSPLCFRPLAPRLHSFLDLVYRRYQRLSPIAQLFLEQVKSLCTEKKKNNC